METADGKGVPSVKRDAKRLLPFEDKDQGLAPANGNLACVYSVGPFAGLPEIVSMLRDSIPALDELAKEPRPRPGTRDFARLPSPLMEGLGDELISGSIQALPGHHEVLWRSSRSSSGPFDGRPAQSVERCGSLS